MFFSFLGNIFSYIFCLFGYISNSNLFPKPLSKTEEEYYLRRYFEGDKEAKNILSNCKKLICCRKSFGSFEKENEELLNWAQEKKIEIEFQNAGEI